MDFPASRFQFGWAINTLFGPVTAIGLACCIGVAVYLRYFYVDFGRIEGIPEIPGGSSLAGHLYMLGGDHASTAETWGITRSWPVYQVRFGYRRAIILNSFDAARDWIVTKQTSTIDRPWLYTFHGVVSKTSGMSIPTFKGSSGSPCTSRYHWDESMG